MLALASRAVKQVPAPAVFTTLTNAGAAGLLVGLAARAGGGTAARALRPRQWGGLLILGVIGGSIPFLLFFTGLAQASAPSAAFIHKTLFIWVALLAIPFLGERLRWRRSAAALVDRGRHRQAAPVGWRSTERRRRRAARLRAHRPVRFPGRNRQARCDRDPRPDRLGLGPADRRTPVRLRRDLVRGARARGCRHSEQGRG